jgi:NAD(P)-dependent dehydrogenase (short-subunit alcohol dehydrogenase family)
MVLPLKVSLERWEKVMSVNLGGVFLCYKHAAKQMLKQGRGGRIIGASSAAGKQGIASHSTYCASNFAVIGLTQSLGEISSSNMRFHP